MSKIKNIGMLDVRNIDKELAEKITQIENIGIIIESDESQVLLRHCRKLNVGTSLKLPKDLNIRIISQNGNMEVDRSFLEGLTNLVAIVVNGKLVFKDDVDAKLINEKIYSIIANGRVISSKKLAGVIQSKGKINGEFVKYNNGYKFFDGVIKLTNKFLKGLGVNSKLAFNKLLAIEEIDLKLLEEKVSNIQILDSLIIADSYEEEISKYIDEYYSVNQVVVPNSAKGIKYIAGDISLDDNSIKKYDHKILYVDGDVEVFLKDNIAFNEHIEYLICDTLTCNQETYDLIKDSISSDVEIEIIKGKIYKNTGKMILSKNFKEETTIKNMGKLIFDEKLDYDEFEKSDVSIINYGLIVVPEDKLDIVKDKIKDDYGLVKSKEEKQELHDEELLYGNVGELKL